MQELLPRLRRLQPRRGEPRRQGEPSDGCLVDSCQKKLTQFKRRLATRFPYQLMRAVSITINHDTVNRRPRRLANNRMQATTGPRGTCGRKLKPGRRREQCRMLPCWQPLWKAKGTMWIRHYGTNLTPISEKMPWMQSDKKQQRMNMGLPEGRLTSKYETILGHRPSFL